MWLGFHGVALRVAPFRLCLFRSMLKLGNFEARQLITSSSVPKVVSWETGSICEKEVPISIYKRCNRTSAAALDFAICLMNLRDGNFLKETNRRKSTFGTGRIQ
jgi:hypothetical protein